MALSWPAPKDPNEEKDYEVRFGPWLVGGDALASIASCTVAVGDVVIDSSEIVDSAAGPDTAVRIWFSGGTLNETCEVLTRVETTGGRKYDQTCKLKIKAK